MGHERVRMQRGIAASVLGAFPLLLGACLLNTVTLAAPDVIHPICLSPTSQVGDPVSATERGHFSSEAYDKVDAMANLRYEMSRNTFQADAQDRVDGSPGRAITGIEIEVEGADSYLFFAMQHGVIMRSRGEVVELLDGAQTAPEASTGASP